MSVVYHHYMACKRLRVTANKAIFALFLGSIIFVYYKYRFFSRITADEEILKIQSDHRLQMGLLRTSWNLPVGHMNSMVMQQRQSKTFIIYDWSNYNRLLEDGENNEDFVIDNCEVKRNADYITDGDAVAISLRWDQHRIPKTNYRNPKQRWIFLFDDTFANFEPMKCFRAADFNGVFNWTMTYRQDSDIHIPYGTTVPLNRTEKDSVRREINYAKTKSYLAYAMISNCAVYFNDRLSYISELKIHMPLDFYGQCGNLHCSGQVCSEVQQYKFVLAFENTACKDYITEKMWWALHNNIVPVVMGTSKRDYLKVAPPGSYIHVDDFASPKSLAKYLQYLHENDTLYNKYFEWKEYYRVDYRLQYVHNVIWKKLCDKLNSDSGEIKIYNDFGRWVNMEQTCPNITKRYNRC